ncbi:hypothetical protein QL104_10450 [Pseudomonas piscis]|uniref:DUF4224 domain-containing protein n=1 Tax=Pseudomonas piscis TaxID=2614538 RepID=A0ABY9NMN4_9PSED|nr:hypothetical protein [Pseudomonas piscis]WMN19805.1 hypothetical protein QL104_10450 [Pseudomonas piscis]
MKWQAKRDRDGQTIPKCWVTDHGYTVAECRLPHSRYPITRPGAAQPFTYASNREEVVMLIEKDMQATAANS